ncbi:trypsin-like serine peptidase [Fodinicola acaciae]|uniref:trypsin-like serine peptidase n=1 Tax=Fodinicola acaciae TaxID=2681555 RepID=UPI001C9E73EB|nr:trypsin-like peptidase domain-containing protein [Fodinicola acaciae]
MRRRFMVIMAALSATVLATCGLSTPPAMPAAHRLEAPHSEASAYWNAHRLREARPVRAHTARDGQAAKEERAATELRVGGLFYHDVDGGHFCTASVVDSPGRDMILTAAHCVYSEGSPRSDIAFVPDYNAGQMPYGVWTPTNIVVDDRWKSNEDPDVDVAFVELAPNNGRRIADVIGANELVFNADSDQIVRVTGYPSSQDAPITCVNRSSRLSASQLRFACAGFSGGTSGSPWQAAFDPATETGAIVGLIGGYEGGGDTDDVSYSPYFGDDIQLLYDRATSGVVAPS